MTTPSYQEEGRINDLSAYQLINNQQVLPTNPTNISIAGSVNNAAVVGAVVPNDLIYHCDIKMESGYLLNDKCNANWKEEDVNVKSELGNIKREMWRMSEMQKHIINRQDEIVKMLSETNVLLKRSLCIVNTDSSVKAFPLRTELELESLNTELSGEGRTQIILTLKRLLRGNLNNFDKILHQNVIMAYNYDGSLGKKSLKLYPHFLKAVYVANSREGESFEEFTNHIRGAFRLLKNRYHKQSSRNKKLKIAAIAKYQNSDTITSNEFCCDICMEHFANDDQLSAHTRDNHDHLALPETMCTICNCLFDSIISLQAHLDRHIKQQQQQQQQQQKMLTSDDTEDPTTNSINAIMTANATDHNNTLDQHDSESLKRKLN